MRLKLNAFLTAHHLSTTILSAFPIRDDWWWRALWRLQEVTVLVPTCQQHWYIKVYRGDLMRCPLSVFSIEVEHNSSDLRDKEEDAHLHD